MPRLLNLDSAIVKRSALDDLS